MTGLGKTVDQMDTDDLLTIALAWLANVQRQDRERYLDAMPNNVPGLGAMIERRDQIRRAQEQAATVT